MSINCKYCGTPVAQNSETCPGCGNKTTAPQVQTETTYQPDMPSTPPSNDIHNTAPKKEKSRGIKIFLSILCAIFIIPSTLAGLSFSTFSRSISTDNLIDMASEVSIRPFIEGTPLEEVFGEFSDEDVTQLFEETGLKDYLKEIVAFLVENPLEPITIDADTIVTTLKENEDLVAEILGVRLTETDYNEIRNTVNQETNNGVLLSTEGITNDINEQLDVYRTLTSPFFTVLSFAIAALFILLLFAARRNLSASLVWVGTSFIITALLFLMTLVLKTPILEEMALTDDVSAEIGIIIIENIFSKITSTGLIPLGIGVVSIIAGKILQHKKAQKA